MRCLLFPETVFFLVLVKDQEKTQRTKENILTEKNITTIIIT